MKKILLTLLCLCAAVAMASAAEKIAYSVDFLAKNCEIKVGNYFGESKYHNAEGLTFTTKQFSNNNGIWDYIKCGAKSSTTSSDVITNFAVECPITSINIRVDAAQSNKLSACWEIKVLSYPDSACMKEELQVAYTKTPLVGGDNVIVLDPPQCSRYLKVKFECKSGTIGAVAINGVDYMTPGNVSPTWNIPETLRIGEAWELTGSNIADGVMPTVTCSDPSALCAVDGVYYFVKSGEYTVTITTPVEGSAEVSSVSGTVTVSKMPVSLTWMRDGVSVNDQTLSLSTSAVNLPNLSYTAVPAAIADRLPDIPVAVNYNPADQKVLTYDLATNRFTLHGVEAQVAVTASVTGSDIYEDATATMTMDVTNSVTYTWTQAQSIPIPPGFVEKETPKMVSLNATDWTIAASYMFAQWSGGVKLGSSSSKAGTTTFTTKQFAGKVIKGFEITYLASKAMDISVISGGSVVAAGKIVENTATPQTFSWSGSRYSATEWGISLGYLAGANLTITGIKVIYTDRSSDTKDEPSWTPLPCEWKFGEGYDLPAIQGADIDGLAVSVTLNPEDVVQDADSGKWYARRPGTLRATAHSDATDKFEEKTLTLSIPVAKGEYLIGWVIDGQQVSTHTCTTLDRNLPTLATRTFPPCLAAIITNPAVDVKSDYDPSAMMPTMEYARYDKSSNTITPLYAGGIQTFTAYMAGDANFMAATIPLKVEVKNMYTYGWNSASTLVCSDANEKTTGTLTLGDSVWDFSADSSLSVAKENGVAFGQGNPPGIHFSITRTAPFAGTLIKTFMVSAKGSGQLDLMVDDVVIESITLPGGNLPTIYSISTPVYCDRNIRIAGVTGNAAITIDQIAVGYEYASTVKTTPVWKANQTVKMYIGGEYDLPAALNVQEGVTVTISPRAGFDDLVRNEVSGKWSPKHAGLVRLVASSPATSRYNAKQETFTIEVPKADLLLGVEYRGELLPDKASIKISTLDTDLPKIKLADIPSYIAVPTPTVEFTTDPAILKMDGLTITPIGDGEDIVTVSIPASENFNAASYMLVVTVVPGIPKNIFNLPDERRIYWSEFEDHRWSEIPATPIFDAKYDNLVDYTLRPLFDTTQSKHDKGEGVGIYRDCHWYEDTEGNTLLDTDMFSLHLPCSGEYLFTAALKEGVEVPAGYVARKEMKVTVVPSFRKNAANGDAPLTFNHKNVIEADRLPVNTSYMPYLSNCYVQYHGEGTMSLWVKQQGPGLVYTPGETAVGSNPAAPSSQPLEASATAESQHRATSHKGEVIEGKAGTPVEGYRLYGEDGIDFRKGEEVWLVWEKNGVYSDPIHFTAYSSNDPDITGIDSVSAADNDTDAEYYTLDGYRITTTSLASGIYIRRTPQATNLQIIR